MEFENIKKVRTPIRRAASVLKKTLDTESGKCEKISIELIEKTLVKLTARNFL